MQLHRADCLVLVICRNCCNCMAILDVLLNTQRHLALLALVWYDRIDINLQIVDLDIDNLTLIIFADPISREERFSDPVSERVLVCINIFVGSDHTLPLQH